jgi:IS1 transposase
MQAMVHHSPEPSLFFSDAFPTYASLDYYLAQHWMMSDKSQTYSVEADNAELRHYLARLARRSRCFSRCIDALRAAIRIFVYCWNRRQLYKQQYPQYSAHLIDFVPMLP